MASVLIDGEIVLYGTVGDDYWGQGFHATDVLAALAEVGRSSDVTVRINSGGGYLDDGIAIYNALRAHDGKVNVVVDGIAASAASVIAMAGDDRRMATGALLMIHDAATGVFGTVAELEKVIKGLNAQSESMAGIYARACGGDAAAIRTEMRAETWLTAEEAVSRGFATSTDQKAAAQAPAFDYRIYARAPERLVALAANNNWSLRDALKPSPQARSQATQPPRQEAAPVTEKAKTETITPPPAAASGDDKGIDAAKAARERIKAILTSDKAQGRRELAEYYAYETDDPLDKALAALDKAPKAGAGEPAATSYEQRRTQAIDSLARPEPRGGKPESWGGVIADAGLKRKRA